MCILEIDVHGGWYGGMIEVLNCCINILIVVYNEFPIWIQRLKTFCTVLNDLVLLIEDGFVWPYEMNDFGKVGKCLKMLHGGWLY